MKKFHTYLVYTFCRLWVGYTKTCTTAVVQVVKSRSRQLQAMGCVFFTIVPQRIAGRGLRVVMTYQVQYTADDVIYIPVVDSRWRSIV